ncbi:MAG: cobalamin biosynthesis protein [Xanthobacteraceae bacterium]|nr:MAG: cobalamin biosynthesis protein [Xanthobacteraceae bacterium]
METFAAKGWVLLAALALDALVGDPASVWRRWPHPVVWLGALIGALDRELNRESWPASRRCFAGIAAVVLLVAVAAGAGAIVELALRRVPAGEMLAALIASVFIAQKSLYQHVDAVRAAFVAGGLAHARAAVALIVGRDPESLDEGGVCRAAIESCAENFSDGVVAPAFWFALFGLPGLLAYKAVNTADSMIGHRTPRHEAFGWAAARLDDVMNLVPARLAGVLIALAAPVVRGSVVPTLTIMGQEARQHRSPNAGWPESAMAAALGVVLAGPRRYGATIADDPLLNAAGRAAGPADIGGALRLMVAACILHAALYAAFAIAL